MIQHRAAGRSSIDQDIFIAAMFKLRTELKDILRSFQSCRAGTFGWRFPQSDVLYLCTTTRRNELECEMEPDLVLANAQVTTFTTRISANPQGFAQDGQAATKPNCPCCVMRLPCRAMHGSLMDDPRQCSPGKMHTNSYGIVDHLAIRVSEASFSQDHRSIW